jgi:hypothetical protein
MNLLLWRPGTKKVSGLRGQERRIAQSTRPGASQHIAYRAKTTAWYYVEAKLVTRGMNTYTLGIARK